MEKFFYEIRPYFFGGLSVWTLANYNHIMVGKASALLLGLCALIVIIARLKNRGKI